MRSETDELERVGYEIWLAPEVEELDGWRLRFAHGLTGRANSVWPNGDGSLPLEEKLERAESWYRERDRTPAFQITEAARPLELDDVLARRGYLVRAAPVSVQTAALADVLERTHGDALLSEELDDTWLRLWTATRDFDRFDVARALLTGGRAAFARIDEVAVGRAAVAGEWLGITSMATLPDARRRGHGRAILHTLVRWGAQAGCTRVLLQVEHGNVAAETLYARAGFAPHHDYHYRVLP